MIVIKQAEDETMVRNVTVMNDTSGPYNKIINWIGKGADGYIIIFSDAVNLDTVKSFVSSINTSLENPKELAMTRKGLSVRVVTHSEFKGMGGKFVSRDAILTPTRVTIFQYRYKDGIVEIYISDSDSCGTVIPILVNYTVTYKKQMLFMGHRRAYINILNKNCLPGSMFYKVTGRSIKYPITKQMITSGFSVPIGKENITVFSGGVFGRYYNVKQKSI